MSYNVNKAVRALCSPPSITAVPKPLPPTPVPMRTEDADEYCDDTPSAPTGRVPRPLPVEIEVDLPNRPPPLARFESTARQVASCILVMAKNLSRLPLYLQYIIFLSSGMDMRLKLAPHMLRAPGYTGLSLSYVLRTHTYNCMLTSIMLTSYSRRRLPYSM